MAGHFLLYGANGTVGREAARLAVARGLKPIVAGRDGRAIPHLAAQWGLEPLVVRLDQIQELQQALSEVEVVLNCAGPFRNTFRPIVEACLTTGTHYLDLTGELTVYEEIDSRGDQAAEAGIMLLPGAGFDVVATDCLALGLHERLPGATHLQLAFFSDGPAGPPPGTLKTALEVVPAGIQRRSNGIIESAGTHGGSRLIDFGDGPRPVTRLTWGDVFTAYRSTGIPNIEVFAAFEGRTQQWLGAAIALRHLFRVGLVRALASSFIRRGPTREQRAATRTHVWGEVRDSLGSSASARLHGPEAGVEWTVDAALLATQRVLDGDYQPGYQTPATAFGSRFVRDCRGVTYEPLERPAGA